MSKRLEGTSQRLESSMNTSTAEQARAMMWAAVPRRIEDNRKSWLARVARDFGWEPRRARALFYMEARIVTADEWRTLQARYDAVTQSAKERGENNNVQSGATNRVAGRPLPAAGGSIRAVVDVDAGEGEARPPP